ncbi:hypothetical protein D1007_13241 [Hordeum vulgare]|nr:hypothetical protein D1007_13241 [Hordeum vulgare]
MRPTSRSNSDDDEPPSATSSLSCRAMDWADALISGDSMASLTIFSTTALSHTSFMSSPVFHTAPTKRLLVCWSAKKGQQTAGTPSTAASSVEFHPPCVRKHPTARCRSTWCASRCSAHSTTNALSMPAPATASTASRRDTAAVIWWSMSRRNTHRKAYPAATRPWRNSASCSLEIIVRLPRFTYTTDRSSWPSSHAVKLMSSPLTCSVSVSAAACRALARLAWRGPTAKTSRMCGAMPESASPSMDAEVLSISARDSPQRAAVSAIVCSTGTGSRPESTSSSSPFPRCSGTGTTRGRSRRRRKSSIPATPCTCSSEGTGSSPSSRSLGTDRYARKPHALSVRNASAGTPIPSATLMANGITPSATTHVTASSGSDSIVRSSRARYAALATVRMDSTSSMRPSTERGWSSGRPSGTDSRRRRG